jgi:hypothetical protein
MPYIKKGALLNPVPEGVVLSADGISFPSSAMLEKNSMAEILKELFDPDKIPMITDLTTDEIKLCTRIYIISYLKNIPVWRKGLKIYMKLLLSRKRQSRSEIIRAIEGISRKKNIGERIKEVFKPGD